MLRSTDRILVSHAGTLPRTEAVARLFDGGSDDELESVLPEEVHDVVRQQAKVVIAGTDCGIGTRVGHAEIAWAKLEAMVEGARIATKQLWGK